MDRSGQGPRERKKQARKISHRRALLNRETSSSVELEPSIFTRSPENGFLWSRVAGWLLIRFERYLAGYPGSPIKSIERNIGPGRIPRLSGKVCRWSVPVWPDFSSLAFARGSHHSRIFDSGTRPRVISYNLCSRIDMSAWRVRNYRDSPLSRFDPGAGQACN